MSFSCLESGALPDYIVILCRYYSGIYIMREKTNLYTFLMKLKYNNGRNFFSIPVYQ